MFTLRNPNVKIFVVSSIVCSRNMAPKGKAKSKAKKPKSGAEKKPIVEPIVSEAEFDKAAKILESEEELKRARSDLSYFLNKQGVYDQYKGWDKHKKKEFTIKFFADKLSNPTTKASFRNFKVAETVEKAADNFVWMSKKKMIDEFGPEKTSNKISSNKLETQPDPDTGLTGEWDLEYKVWTKGGGTEESVSRGSKLDADADIDEANRQTTDDTFESMAANMAGNHKLEVKPDPEASADSKISEPAAAPDGPKEYKSQKTHEALQKDTKKVLRNLSDLITTLKEMFTKTGTNKFADTLHNEIKLLIPKAAVAYKKLEAAHLKEALRVVCPENSLI